MADFPALGAAHAAHFAGGKGRHVVVEHEAVFKLAGQRVDALGVAFGAQGGDHQCLCFATCEQGRAMGAWKYTVADFDRTHGARVAAVDAGLARQDLAAHDTGFDLEQQAFHLDFVEFHALGGQVGLDGGIRLAARLGTGLLAADLVGGAQLVFGQCRDLADEGFILGLRGPGAILFPQRLAGFADQVVDGVDGNIALLVAEHHGAQHDFLGQLLRLGFDHQHGGFGARHHQIKLAVLALGLAGVEYEFAIDVAHAGRADRAVERNARDAQRRAHGDHGGDVGIHFRVERDGVHHHVHVVEETFRKQRTDRAVDQAAGQRFKFGWLGLALEKIARNLACGIGFFDVIDRQREEVLPRLGCFGADHGGQHYSAIHVEQHGAGGLAGDLARFHADRVLPPLEGFGDFVEYRHDEFLRFCNVARVVEEPCSTRCHSSNPCGADWLLE